MDSDTTLLTFFFRSPPHISAVELLGSWDNFHHAYRLQHDRRRGKGSWSGTFAFDDIIFDGLEPRFTKPRSGGLKQGGVYWYYYRLDGDVETYDDALECSADCPLMPGQVMNVISVPSEIVQPPSRCRSACYEGALLDPLMETGRSGGGIRGGEQTLDPSDKFAVLRPPPLSKVHLRCISDLALGGRLESQAVSSTKKSRASLPRVATPGVRPHKSRCSSNEEQQAWSDGHDAQRQLPSSTDSSVLDAYAEDWAAGASQSSSLASLPKSLLEGEVDDDEDIGRIFSRFDTSGAASGPQDGRAPEFDLAFPLPPTTISADDTYFSDAPPSSRLHMDALSQTDISPTSSTSEPAPPSREPIPILDAPTFPAQEDFSSPTFTAETLSSAGLNTPFRLSGRYSRGGAANGDPGDCMADATAVQEVTARLEDLKVATSLMPGPPSRAPPPPPPPRRPPPPPPPASVPGLAEVGYALPPPVEVDLKPLLVLPELAFDWGRGGRGGGDSRAAGGSMVEEFLAELGYLGGVIS